jgi:uncharacterized membrane protein
MKYTDMNNNYNEQALQGSYEELTVPVQQEAETFIKRHIFYKLFFLFMIGSIFGCYMEQILFYLHKGIWECRAGVVWGPFSEIYGFGAVIMFLLSRALKEKSPLLIFLAAVISGSAFEYIARLFQEITFDSITWDYSMQPLNIGGRTSLKYGIYWGLLGLLFIKLIFPLLDQCLERIRGKAAFIFTWTFIVFMIVNLIFSAVTVNRWKERLQGIPSQGAVEEFLDQHYDNDIMKRRFPHMRFIDTSDKAA